MKRVLGTLAPQGDRENCVDLIYFSFQKNSLTQSQKQIFSEMVEL